MGHNFQKVLVANRGEIARRIVRTLREMGLESVAIFSEADRDAPHVAEADEAVFVGAAPSNESYLNQEAILEAARAVGAGAIHPGYGFLSENAEFAERCVEAGLVFIGPPAEAIRSMGDKAAAKALAAKVGVPVLEGFALADVDAGEVERLATELGFPLLVKAAAGGGGKGMRAVQEAAELEQALAAARREAEGAFGDGALLLERLVTAPRHVEVQVLADAHGHIVHCFERDCSIQRRHQKVFEEAPSPAVDPELRERLGAAAVDLARAVDYRSAGTVEFLLDSSGEFYFLEMNTRLQVEHPVTECITGLDLVRLQVEVAQGRPLPFEQADLSISGHAIEARLYAEDPSNDFLPATGKVALWRVPELPGLRVDGGVEAGSEVSVHYDPMLAKVIAHGATRDEALRRLHRGLAELALGGPTNNREFLLAVLEHDAFRTGEVDTHFLEHHLSPDARARVPDPTALEAHSIVAMLHRFLQRRARPGSLPPRLPSGWRNNRWRPQEEFFEHAGDSVAVRYVVQAEGRFTVWVERGEEEAKTLDVRLVHSEGEHLVVEIDGVRRRFQVALGAGTLWVHGLGRVSGLVPVPRFPERQAAAVAGGCAAPMTGRVVEVPVAVGDVVSAGTTLVVLEAMKMEHRLQAQADGEVQEVRVEAGQMVDPDEVLVVVVVPLEEDDA